MGHKAIVAYEVTPRVYNVHFSPWGADELKLRDRISQATPYGGDYDGEEEYMTEIKRNQESEDVAGHLAERNPPTKVKQEPKLSNVTIEEAATCFSYLTVEAFFVVDTDMRVQSYVPIPCISVGDTHSGVLVKCENPREYSEIFSKTRTSPWKDFDNMDEWRRTVKEDFGDKVASFSKIKL